jgi:hypothetical protein
MVKHTAAIIADEYQTYSLTTKCVRIIALLGFELVLETSPLEGTNKEVVEEVGPLEQADRIRCLSKDQLWHKCGCPVNNYLQNDL